MDIAIAGLRLGVELLHAQKMGGYLDRWAHDKNGGAVCPRRTLPETEYFKGVLLEMMPGR